MAFKEGLEKPVDRSGRKGLHLSDLSPDSLPSAHILLSSAYPWKLMNPYSPVSINRPDDRFSI
jgi:hypothetical protein